MSTRRWIAFGFLLGTSAACGGGGGGGTEPKPLTGSYTLRTVNGTSLPLPSTFLCGEILTSGRLEIRADSVVRTHSTTRSGTADTTAFEWRGSYTTSPEGKLIVSYSAFLVIRDTISALGGGRVTHRAWITVPATCTGTLLTQVDFDFAHD